MCALLIRLAIDAGRVVSADRLVDDLWAGEPPDSALNALQALVSRLRGVVGRDLIESRSGGYRLTLDPNEVDAVVFERLVAGARSAPENRADALARGNYAAALRHTIDRP